MKIGDPLDEHNDVGPLAREDLLTELVEQVRKSVELGAKILAGGNIERYSILPRTISLEGYACMIGRKPSDRSPQ